jgi:hypothetical protein
MESLGWLCLVVQWELNIFASLISLHQALRALVFSTTSHQTLFRVVADEGCQYQEDSANVAFCTNHFHTILTSIHERLEQ